METLFEISHFPANMSSWSVFMLTLFVKGTLLLAAAGLLVYALRRSSAAVRHLVWCAGLLSLLVLPVLSALLPQWQTGLLPQATGLLPETRRPASQEAPAPLSLLEAPVPAPAIASPPPPIIDEASAPAVVATPKVDRAEIPAVEKSSPSILAGIDYHWSTWVFLVWLAGLLFGLIRMAIAHAGVYLLVSRGAMVRDNNWRQLAGDMADRLGIRRAVRLRWSVWTAVPLSVGVWRPTIILPEMAKMWDERHRRTVLLHELAHVRRRDCLMQFLTRVTCSIHWFNPLVWVAARQLRIERERATDDMVLLAGMQASSYAEILLQTARLLHTGKWSAVAALAMARHSQLKDRLVAILDPSLRHRSLSRAGIIMAVVLVACIALPLAVLNPAQARRDILVVADDVAADAGLTLLDSRVFVSDDIKHNPEFGFDTNPRIDLKPGVVIDDIYEVSNDYIPNIDRNWQATSMDTLTAEQRKMLRNRYGIDSTFIHQVHMLLGFTDVVANEFIALATYDVDPSYIRGVQAAGFTDLTIKKLITLAKYDVDPNYIRGVQAAGFTELTLNELVAMSGYDVDPNYIRDVRAAGFEDLEAHHLSAMAKHDIDAKYIRDVQAAGFSDIGPYKLVALAKFRVDPDYIRDVQAAGFADLTKIDLITLALNDVNPDSLLQFINAVDFIDTGTHELVILAQNDIDPDYIRGIQAAGLQDLSAEEIVALARFEINPKFIRAMQAAGLENLTADELVTLARFDINPEFVRAMQAAGLENLSANELVALARFDIDPDYIRTMQAAGLQDLSADELVALARFDIDPDYIRAMQEVGLADLTVNGLVDLTRFDIEPNYIRAMQAAGFENLSSDELVLLAKYDIKPNYIRAILEVGLADLTVNGLVALVKYDIDPDYIRGLKATGFTDLTVSAVIAQARKSLRED